MMGFSSMERASQVRVLTCDRWWFNDCGGSKEGRNVSGSCNGGVEIAGLELRRGTFEVAGRAGHSRHRAVAGFDGLPDALVEAGIEA